MVGDASHIRAALRTAMRPNGPSFDLPKLAQIDRLHKRIHHPNGIVLIDPVVQAFRKQSSSGYEIVEAIANGNAPADLTVTMLARALPHGWAAQEHKLGIT